MTKTIEDAAREYYLNEVINGDTCDDKDGWTDCFVSGAKALIQLPLCDRLTTEEKERVRVMYKRELEFAQFYQRKANSCINQQCRMDYEASRDIAKSRANMLESIFGKEMFEKGENEIQNR